jgi:hypothetical protein
MAKTQEWMRACLIDFQGWDVLVPAWAQSGAIKPEDEYKKLLWANEGSPSLGAHTFSETTGFYSAPLAFVQIKVRSSGRDLLLHLTRTLQIRGHGDFISGRHVAVFDDREPDSTVNTNPHGDFGVSPSMAPIADYAGCGDWLPAALCRAANWCCLARAARVCWAILALSSVSISSSLSSTGVSVA